MPNPFPLSPYRFTTLFPTIIHPYDPTGSFTLRHSHFPNIRDIPFRDNRLRSEIRGRSLDLLAARVRLRPGPHLGPAKATARGRYSG